VGKVIVPKYDADDFSGGSAPDPPEFIALWATSREEKRRAGDLISLLPCRIATCVSAQVALQRCPILLTGRESIP